MISTAPRFAETKAIPVTQAGRERPAGGEEFPRSECFLFHHRSQLAFVDEATGLPVCADCAR